MIADAENDPDNHYIWYENRVLLNEQAEVIVQDSLGNNVLYKFLKGGVVTVENENYDLLQGLNPLNPPNFDEPAPPVNDPPEDNPDLKFFPKDPCNESAMDNSFTNNPEENNGPWGNYPSDPNSGDCDPTDGDNTPSQCDKSGVYRKYINVFDDIHVIKVVGKYKKDGFLFFKNRKMKAKTKYYRLGPGNDKAYGFLNAKLETEVGIECGSGFKPLTEEDYGHAFKAKVKWDSDDLNDIDPNIGYDDVFATHSVEGQVELLDMRDGQIQP